MQNPTVSFIVPCYKLGHLLPECIRSIVSQTYTDFEVLIMDDCSPDNTAEVAKCFRDLRVKHVRNEQNLGHLRNYNKGISLSRGEYVWLISADDRLRRPYVLERYIQFIESHTTVGYVCCPGIALEDSAETTVLQCGYFGPRDRIFDGRDFIATSLRNAYGLLAPSVMVRKACYEKIGVFPLDMPHQGDWYLWLRWALEYDVGYLSEPMVNYRFHDLNIMKSLLEQRDTVFKDEVGILWRFKSDCEREGFRTVAEQCENALASRYARAAASAVYVDVYSSWRLSTTQCDHALLAGASNPSEYKRLRGKFFAYLANAHWRHGAFGFARLAYLNALRADWRMPRVWLKMLCLKAGLGRTGVALRRLVPGRNQPVSRRKSPDWQDAAERV